MCSTSKARSSSSHHQRRSHRESCGSNGLRSISTVTPSTPSLRSAWCRVARADQPRARCVTLARRACPARVIHVISSVRKRLPLITQLRTSRCTAAQLGDRPADEGRGPPHGGELRQAVGAGAAAGGSSPADVRFEATAVIGCVSSETARSQMT